MPAIRLKSVLLPQPDGPTIETKTPVSRLSETSSRAWTARRPVKVGYTFEEMFYQITRHPSTFRIKSGVDKNGKIVARKCEVYWNGGAYADIGPRVTQKSGLTATGPYNIDDVWVAIITWRLSKRSATTPAKRPKIENGT